MRFPLVSILFSIDVALVGCRVPRRFRRRRRRGTKFVWSVRCAVLGSFAVDPSPTALPTSAAVARLSLLLCVRASVQRRDGAGGLRPTHYNAQARFGLRRYGGEGSRPVSCNAQARFWVHRIRARWLGGLLGARATRVREAALKGSVPDLLAAKAAGGLMTEASDVPSSEAVEAMVEHLDGDGVQTLELPLPCPDLIRWVASAVAPTLHHMPSLRIQHGMRDPVDLRAQADARWLRMRGRSRPRRSWGFGTGELVPDDNVTVRCPVGGGELICHLGGAGRDRPPLELGPSLGRGVKGSGGGGEVGGVEGFDGSRSRVVAGGGLPRCRGGGSLILSPSIPE